MYANGNCEFCKIAYEDKFNQIIKRYNKREINGTCDVIVFEPINPICDGHLLFVPQFHIDNIGDTKYLSPMIIGSVYSAINKYLTDTPIQCKVLTNNGVLADQTVFHFHVHLIPAN